MDMDLSKALEGLNKIDNSKLESKLEDYLVKKAKELDYMVVKLLPFAMKGLPDRMIIGHGKVFYIELKKPDYKKNSKKTVQKVRIDEIRSKHVAAYMLNSKEDIETVLYHHIKEEKPIKIGLY